MAALPANEKEVAVDKETSSPLESSEDNARDVKKEGPEVAASEKESGGGGDWAAYVVCPLTRGYMNPIL